MKVLIFLLILISLIQAAFLPIDLILLFLIARGYILGSRSDYWLAFSLGLLVGLLLGQPLGVTAIIYLFLVWLTHFVRKLPISTNWFVLSGLAFILIMSNELIHQLIFKTSFNLGLVIIMTLLMIPVYFGVLFWEERFVVRKDVKLKL